MRKILLLSALCGIALVSLGIYFVFISNPGGGGKVSYFTVPLGASANEVFLHLKSEGFTGHPSLVRGLLVTRGVWYGIPPGGYALSKNMSAWSIAKVLGHAPELKWVVIPEGLRKEEIADIIAESLGWSGNKKEEFLVATAAKGSDYLEGVYFPDTYLMPAGGSGTEAAARMIARFNEQFAQFSSEAARQNMKWTTVVKVASLIQREAAGKGDMPLIAGILWNRLNQSIPLQVDSTVQYARGDVGEGWWAPLKSGETKISSPYNTYLHTGLPPHPISNPGVDALRAALFPAQTDCLYYLHDEKGAIHCAATFAEHERNIEKFLKTK